MKPIEIYLADIKYIQNSNDELVRKMTVEVCKYITNKCKSKRVVGQKWRIHGQHSISLIYSIIFYEPINYQWNDWK